MVSTIEKKKKKAITIIGLLLGLFSVVSCSKGDSKDDDRLLANAQGIMVVNYGSGVDVEDVYLWINNNVVKNYQDWDLVNPDILRQYGESIRYYELTMDRIYKMLSENGYYGFPVIDEKTDLNELELQKFVSYIKSNLSKYKYVAKVYNDTFLLFNRTSDTNY